MSESTLPSFLGLYKLILAPDILLNHSQPQTEALLKMKQESQVKNLLVPRKHEQLLMKGLHRYCPDLTADC